MMGATSVTGVSGSGSAASPGVGGRGSENMNLAVHRLIGPRVVMAGQITLDPSLGTGTVYFPVLPGTAALYAVFLSSQGSATFPYWGGFTTSSFNVTGGDSQVVCWEIVKKGLWGSPTDQLANT
jgi:hypothetical protein